MGTTHSFDFLQETEATQPPSFTAVIGDDRFLKRLCLTKIRHQATEDGAAVEFPSKTPWRDVHDEISTLSLFGDGPRVVVIQDADDFVKENRSHLESFATKTSAGCLILDLKSLASNTRLYKALKENGQIIDCNPPQTTRGKSSFLDEARLCQWIREWGESTHGIKVKRGADEELLGLAGAELGLIDQELAKLALFCSENDEVTVELVQKVVGGWRAKTSWDLFDAALDGDAADAMLQLDRLLQSGEAPQMILGGLIWSLRRFANAAHIIIESEAVGRRVSLAMALEQAGIRKWPKGALQRAETQIRQLGRDRAAALYNGLLKLDLSMKGSHAAPHRSRWALEQFILWLSKAANAA